MTDFQAALLLSQLRKIEKFRLRRRQIVKRYDEAFRDIPEIIVQKEICDSESCRHLYVIRLDLHKLTCTRKMFFEAMTAENVIPQIHYIPVYWFPDYQRMGYKKGICPNAEEVYESILSIPLFPGMEDQDVDDVICAVKKIVTCYRK